MLALGFIATLSGCGFKVKVDHKINAKPLDVGQNLTELVARVGTGITNAGHEIKELTGKINRGIKNQLQSKGEVSAYVPPSSQGDQYPVYLYSLGNNQFEVILIEDPSQYLVLDMEELTVTLSESVFPMVQSAESDERFEWVYQKGSETIRISLTPNAQTNRFEGLVYYFEK